MTARTRDTFDSASVRNLEQIRETDASARSPRLTAMVMASFGGACIVFTALALMRGHAKPVVAATDPLDALVARGAAVERGPAKVTLSPEEVTFPAVLSDQAHPTTAMEAVRRGSAGQTAPPSEQPVAATPPPAEDRLPVAPLPAQDVLNQNPAAVAPTDTLRVLARAVARRSEGTTLAEPGHPGGYQLQVSSFRKQPDADGFALVLRRRGHRAYVQAAQVKGRGLWYRVRIGPFKYQRSANIYRQDFEAKERMVTFVVRPPQAHIRIAPAAAEP